MKEKNNVLFWSSTNSNVNNWEFVNSSIQLKRHFLEDVCNWDADFEMWLRNWKIDGTNWRKEIECLIGS